MIQHLLNYLRGDGNTPMPTRVKVVEFSDGEVRHIPQILEVFTWNNLYWSPVGAYDGGKVRFECPEEEEEEGRLYKLDCAKEYIDNYIKAVEQYKPDVEPVVTYIKYPQEVIVSTIYIVSGYKYPDKPFKEAYRKESVARDKLYEISANGYYCCELESIKLRGRKRYYT